MAVLDGAWVGAFAYLTRPDRRRAGLAQAVSRALALAARERGAQRIYHQTERDNVPALSLSSALGLTEIYGYHYRVSR